MQSQIIYPAIPPAPAAPTLAQVTAGALSGRTEYYVLTYVTPWGEAFASAETSITIATNKVAVVTPPAYPYPWPIFGYNVYASTSMGTEVLQNGSNPILPGEPWIEPVTGLVTGTASPPTAWTATTFTFGAMSFPTKVPAYVRETVRHRNVAASGVLETIYEHTDFYTTFAIDFTTIGADVDGWRDFVEYAERGGIFSFYPDASVGGGGSGFKNYTLWDDNWTAAYKAPQLYMFGMQWREAQGAVGTGPITPGGGGALFADNITPLDSGDHQHFTLPQAPNPPASLELFLDGVIVTDYVLSGTSITFTSAITGTFGLQAWYRY